MAREPLDLLQGTLDVLILKTLTWGAAHGYGVSRAIRERSEGTLAVEDAALYQALHRLERQRLVEAEWGLSENNRRAKFYQLTAAGRQRLREETATWRRYATAVGRILEPV
jgi:PadR family transcriptional regulator, regulatory protein PadR